MDGVDFAVVKVWGKGERLRAYAPEGPAIEIQKRMLSGLDTFALHRVVMTEKGSAEAFVLTSANPGFALSEGVGAENLSNANHTLRLLVRIGRAA
jgi:hypothetical protein